MTAGQQCGKRFLDDPLLAEDRAADLGSNAGEALDGRLDLVCPRSAVSLNKIRTQMRENFKKSTRRPLHQ
jgi:hypothetical protein